VLETDAVSARRVEVNMIWRAYISCGVESTRSIQAKMLQGFVGFMDDVLQAYKDASEIDGGEVESVKRLDCAALCSKLLEAGLPRSRWLDTRRSASVTTKPPETTDCRLPIFPAYQACVVSPHAEWPSSRGTVVCASSSSVKRTSRSPVACRASS
jgi:hypothetical protein